MAFLKTKLLSKLGEVPSSSLDFSGPVLIFFSASWALPCLKFTTSLADFYNKEKRSNKKLEIIFASLDSEIKFFDHYSDKMPWLSIPFEKRNVVDMLAYNYELEQIPFLVQVDKEGELLANNCQDIILEDPNLAYDYFMKLIKRKV